MSNLPAAPDLRLRLPGNTRQLVRDAVRKVLDSDAAAANGTAPRALAFMAGRKINDLPNADLLNVAHMLGIDAPAIVAAAAHNGAAGAAFRPAPRVDTGEADGDDTEDAPGLDAPAIDLDAAAAKLRRDLSMGMIEGDFTAVTASIRDLLEQAHKPAIVQTIVEYVDGDGAPAAPPIDAPRPAVAPVGSATWAKLFGTAGGMKSRTERTYAPTALTPAIDSRYRFPMGTTEAALCAWSHGLHVWLFGPAGTGKSSWPEQYAANTGRPYFLIPCDDTTEAPELVGMTVPYQGGTRWQDGVLTAAIRTPNAVILIDEPTVARPGALMVLQSVLASGVLSLKENGVPVRVAPGVLFIVADNTNGTGGGGAEGYEGTRRLNRATLDRFANFLRIDYMSPKTEAEVLVSRTGCTPELAAILVECAGLTRKAKVTHALGLRRLIAWAHALSDGLPPRIAFEATILNACAKDDREPTEQCCALGLDKARVTAALQGVAPSAAPITPAPDGPLSKAAADFAG